MGRVPNFFKTLAKAPAALRASVAYYSSLADGVLNEKKREAIAIAVSAVNACKYCVSAHASRAMDFGATPEDIADFAEGRSADPRMGGILMFARAVALTNGKVGEGDFWAANAVGLSENELIEIIGWVGFFTFANMFADALDIDVDYPAFHKALIGAESFEL